MKTYNELIKWAEQYIAEHNLETEAAKFLIMHFADMESWKLLTNINEYCPEDIEQNIIHAVKRYADDLIPIQYIIGTEMFLGYEFIVNHNVLIPRFETEELVLKLLETFDEVFDDSIEHMVVDIGTGSGAIAISLSLEEPRMKVHASDISREALEVAMKNNEKLKANVLFSCGDMLEPYVENNMKFDVLVSNPPYIPINENVDAIIANNEPKIALYGDRDGLFFYKKILKDAKKILNNKNIIAFEHAYDKAREIRELSKFYFPNAEIKTYKDLQGKDRITIIINEVI